MIEQNQINSANSTESKVENELINARKKSLQQLKTKTDGDFSWLTDHSRKFLASGYLTEGVSAEERIKEIADRANWKSLGRGEGRKGGRGGGERLSITLTLTVDETGGEGHTKGWALV